MQLPRLGRLRLPSRIALLLGIGALSTAGVPADTAHASRADAELLPRTEPTGLGDLLISSYGGRLFVIQPGSGAEELRLGNTPEAQHLRQLLRHHGAEAKDVRLNRMILAGGGGKGISGGHWKPVRSERPEGSRKTRSAAPATVPDPTNAPRNSGTFRSGNSPVTENNK